MADPTSPVVENETSEQQPAAPTGRPTSFLVRIGALVFLVAVVLGECLFAFVLISRSSSETAAVAGPPSQEADSRGEQAKADLGNTHKEGDVHPTNAAEEGAAVVEQVEVDLEQFGVTAHQPAANSTMRIDFHLYGVIAARDKEEFDKLLKGNQHRFREQVLVTVRSAEGPDLADAGLGLIKRQILEKTNTLLGKPLLKAIIVSDFSYIEQ
jgi:flagellar FliL protein